MDDFLKVASLSEEDVDKIRLLEKATGTHIMAFEPGLKVAVLSEDNLERIQELESELGATLLVFKSK
ncbi:MAG: hypothetical protein ACK2U0_07045 [Candidatus Promineifilaceae bacterium]|jgi:hypothetical protein